MTLEAQEIEEQIQVHTKLKNQYEEELKSEQERMKAVLRTIVHAENKIDSLKQRLQEIQAKTKK